MNPFKRATCFGGQRAIRVGGLCATYFRDGKRVFGLCHPRSVAMKHGTFNLVALNIGRFLFMYESPVV